MTDGVCFLFLVSDEDTLTGLSSYTFSLLAAFEKEYAGPITLLTTWTELAVRRAVTLSRTRVETVKPSHFPIISPIIRSFRARKALKQLGGKPVVISTVPYGLLCPGLRQTLVVHDLYMLVPGRYKWHQRLFFTAFFGLLARMAEKVVCVSQATADELLAWRPSLRARTVVVHEAARYPLTPNAYNEQSDYGLFVANIEKNKNVQCLLDALAMIPHESRPTIRWVGRDRSGEVADWVAAHGPMPSFVSQGVVGDNDLMALYRGARFLIVSSSKEGFCLPVLEAQAFGVPVIATDIPVLREVGGQGAVYFPEGSAPALAETMQLAMQPLGPFRGMSTLALANAARFSWSAAAKDFIALLRR